jgi:hypothetical protein
MKSTKYFSRWIELKEEKQEREINKFNKTKNDPSVD